MEYLVLVLAIIGFVIWKNNKPQPSEQPKQPEQIVPGQLDVWR